MSTILLRLSAPWQSWGTSSRFPERKTEKAPSKSAVIGMIAAGMGIRRGEDISFLSHLNFGVRVDQMGDIERDYHIATQWNRDTGRKDSDAMISNRYYLSDYVFIVGLEGDEELLSRVEYALNHPKFHLFLGRKSCVPDTPMVIGIEDKGLMESLRSLPWSAAKWYKDSYPDSSLDIIRDGLPGESGDIVSDIPVSFSRVHREYGKRTVVREKNVRVSHDPMSTIEES